MTFHLSLQARFYDQIASGKKNIEYRAELAKYMGMERVVSIVFTAPGRRPLCCDVVDVKLKKKPSDWDDCPWLSTPRMWCIRLGSRRLL